jgi:hypothetical protein
MKDLETFESFLELGRETVVELDLGGEEGVAACWGQVQEEESGESRRLLFVGYLLLLCSV